MFGYKYRLYARIKGSNDKWEPTIYTGSTKEELDILICKRRTSIYEYKIDPL